MDSKEKKTVQGEFDNYDYRTAVEMTLDEQIDSTKQALIAANRLLENNNGVCLNKKIKEIEQRQQQIKKIKLHLEKYDSYEVIDPDDASAEEIIKWGYAMIRDNLLVRGLGRKEVLLLLQEYKLKGRLEKMTVDQLQNGIEQIADEIFSIKDTVICNRCHSGKIKVFEDRGGYSVRCDFCNAVNYCRCSSEEMAVNFWIKGITQL